MLDLEHGLGEAFSDEKTQSNQVESFARRQIVDIKSPLAFLFEVSPLADVHPPHKLLKGQQAVLVRVETPKKLIEERRLDKVTQK